MLSNVQKIPPVKQAEKKNLPAATVALAPIPSAIVVFGKSVAAGKPAKEAGKEVSTTFKNAGKQLVNSAKDNLKEAKKEYKESSTFTKIVSGGFMNLILGH